MDATTYRWRSGPILHNEGAYRIPGIIYTADITYDKTQYRNVDSYLQSL